MNRNVYFSIGVVLIIVGLQFRAIDSFVLNDTCSKFLAKRFSDNPVASNNAFSGLVPTPSGMYRRTITPPRWLGWSLLSLGVVAVCHCFILGAPKSEG